MAYTDKYLMSMWRKAVLKFWKNKCIFCGDSDISRIETHHIVKRKHKLLRYDYRNGVPCCSVITKRNNFLWNGKTCHQFAETPKGRAIIHKGVDIDYLTKLSLINYKDFLVQYGITDAEFKKIKMEELKGVINGQQNIGIKERNIG